MSSLALIEFLRMVAEDGSLRMELQQDFAGTIDQQSLSEDEKDVLKSGCQYRIVCALVGEALGIPWPAATVINKNLHYYAKCRHPECIAFFDYLGP